MKCIQCGKINSPKATYCSKCSAPLPTAAMQTEKAEVFVARDAQAEEQAYSPPEKKDEKDWDWEAINKMGPGLLSILLPIGIIIFSAAQHFPLSSVLMVGFMAVTGLFIVFICSR